MLVLKSLAKNINLTVATGCNTASGRVAFSEDNRVQDVSGVPAEQSVMLTLNIPDISFWLKPIASAIINCSFLQEEMATRHRTAGD